MSETTDPDVADLELEVSEIPVDADDPPATIDAVVDTDPLGRPSEVVAVTSYEAAIHWDRRWWHS